MPELAVENLTKVYSNGNKDGHVVLKDVSFTVRKGEFVSVLGPSGCGKTTILNIIAGFLRPTSGRVIAGDTEVSKPGPDRAFVFQNYALFPWMTVKDNILYPMEQQNIPKVERERQLKELLTLANLEGEENLFPRQLSGGMQQRTGVIRALACRPRVLLMDEPLGAVDMQMRRKLQDDMERIFIKDPTTVVMVTHDPDEAVFLSDRVLVMSDCQGKMVADISVKLDRPRDRRLREYHDMVNKLSEILQNIEHDGVSNRSGSLNAPSNEPKGIPAPGRGCHV